MRLRNTESIWRESLGDNEFCFHLEIRGLLDQARNIHEWIKVGTYGTRGDAEAALKKIRKEDA